MRKSIAKVLVGLSMLPTSTKFNLKNPSGSNAFAPNQYVYILLSTNPEDLKGGPEAVIVTSFIPLVDGEVEWKVGTDVNTKHFSEKKNLPSRRVVGIITPDGAKEGQVPALSLPHWEAMTEGDTSVAVTERIESNRAKNSAPKAEKKAAFTL